MYIPFAGDQSVIRESARFRFAPHIRPVLWAQAKRSVRLFFKIKVLNANVLLIFVLSIVVLDHEWSLLLNGSRVACCCCFFSHRPKFSFNNRKKLSQFGHNAFYSHIQKCQKVSKLFSDKRPKRLSEKSLPLLSAEMSSLQKFPKLKKSSSWHWQVWGVVVCRPTLTIQVGKFNHMIIQVMTFPLIRAHDELRSHTAKKNFVNFFLLIVVPKSSQPTAHIADMLPMLKMAVYLIDKVRRYRLSKEVSRGSKAACWCGNRDLKNLIFYYLSNISLGAGD